MALSQFSITNCHRWIKFCKKLSPVLCILLIYVLAVKTVALVPVVTAPREINHSIAQNSSQTENDFDEKYSSLKVDDLMKLNKKSGPEIFLERVPSKFNFIIREADFCKRFLIQRRGISKFNMVNNSTKTSEQIISSSAPPLLTVAVVESAVRNWRERQNVRSTWGHAKVVEKTGVSKS